MRVFFTRIDGYSVPDLDGIRREMDADWAATELGLREEMPFFINGDGSYDEHLNRFMHQLAGGSARSPHTWRAYAQDIVTWVLYLAETRGKTKSWLHATADDFRDYQNLRRGDNRKYRVAATSWNRSLASLTRLYRWAFSVGLIDDLPFELVERTRTVETASGKREVTSALNQFRESVSAEPPIRYVSPDQYRYFRDVGLRGRWSRRLGPVELA